MSAAARGVADHSYADEVIGGGVTCEDQGRGWAAAALVVCLFPSPFLCLFSLVLWCSLVARTPPPSPSSCRWRLLREKERCARAFVGTAPQTSPPRPCAVATHRPGAATFA